MAEPRDLLLDLSDRVNPIVVKDVRQGLRTRTFALSFGFLLAGAVLVSVVAWTTWNPAAHNDTPLGLTVFAAYLGCYVLIGCFGLPLSVHRQFAREREAETWQLLVMTGVRPRRLLRGKIASGLVQGALYASAIAPFMLFSYFLEGVSLVAILLSMAAAFAWQAFLTTAAVATATFGGHKVARGIVGAAWGLSLPLLTFGLGSAYATMLFASRAGVGLPPDGWVLGAWAWVVLSLGVLLFEAAAARLMSAGENHALGPRLAAFAHVAGLGAIVLASKLNDAQVDLVLLGYGSAFAFLYGLFATSDADAAARGLRGSRVPRLLWPGARRGFVAALGLLALAYGGALLLPGGGSARHERLFVLGPTWVAIYLSLPVVVCRGLAPDALGGAVAMRFVTAGLALFGLVVPVLLPRNDTELMGLLNPFLSDADSSFEVPLATAAVLVTAAFVILLRRERAAERA